MTKAEPVYLSLNGREFLKVHADASDVRTLFEALDTDDADAAALWRFFSGVKEKAAGRGDGGDDEGSVASESPSVVSGRLRRLQRGGGGRDDAAAAPSKALRDALAHGDYVDPAVDDAPSESTDDGAEATASAATASATAAAPGTLLRPRSAAAPSLKSPAVARTGSSAALSLTSHARTRSKAAGDADVTAAKEERGAAGARSREPKPADDADDDGSVRTCRESAIEVVERNGKTSVGVYRRSKGDGKAKLAEKSLCLLDAVEETAGREHGAWEAGAFQGGDATAGDANGAKEREESEKGEPGIEAVRQLDRRVEVGIYAPPFPWHGLDDGEEERAEPGVETVNEEGRTPGTGRVVIGIFAPSSARRGGLARADEEGGEGTAAGNVSWAVDGEEVRTVSLGSRAMERLLSCAGCHPCAGGAEEESGDPSDVREEDAHSGPSSSDGAPEEKDEASVALVASAASGSTVNLIRDASFTTNLFVDEWTQASDRDPETVTSDRSTDVSKPALESDAFATSQSKWIDPLRNKTSILDEFHSEEIDDERDDCLDRENPAEDDGGGREDGTRAVASGGGDVNREIPLAPHATPPKAAVDEGGSERSCHDDSKEVTLAETRLAKDGTKRRGGAKKRLGRYWRAARAKV